MFFLLFFILVSNEALLESIRHDPAVSESPWLSEPIQKTLICVAVARLKLEFHNIMTRVTDANKGPSSTNLSSSTSDGTSTSGYEINVAHNSPSEGAIYDLWRIAKRMNLAGYVGECFEVYKNVRKGFLDTNLKQLGIKKMSTCETRGLLLEEFKKKIDQLIRAAKACYSILLLREKKLF